MSARHTGCLAVAVAVAALAGCAGPAARQREDWPWGRTRRGLQSRIVFEKHVYKQGEPIVCWVEVRNASDKPVPYDGRVGADIRIVGPDGQEPPDIGWKFFSTAEEVKEEDFDKLKSPPQYRYPVLKPSEVLLLRRRRLDEARYMGTPGTYRFRWPGADPLPVDWLSPQEEAIELLARDWDHGQMPAPRRYRAAPREVRGLPAAREAAIEVVLAPGGLPHGDLIGRLLRVMPPYWEMERPGIVATEVELPDRRPGWGSVVGFFHSPLPGMMMNVVYVSVWVIANAAERDPGAAESPAEYLGRGKLGHVYVERRRGDFGDPEARWLYLAYDIASALEIEPLPPKPDGPDWGRLVCRILRECLEQSRKRRGLGHLCRHGRLTCGEGNLVKMQLTMNLAPTSTGPPRARKDPGSPYYDVLFAVRLAKNGDQAGEWDRTVEWRTAAGTKGEVCWRIASDDAPFARALRAIFGRETRKFLAEQHD